MESSSQEKKEYVPGKMNMNGNEKFAPRGVRKSPWEPKQHLPLEIPKELIPENAVDITFGKTGKLWKVLLEPGDLKRTCLPRRGSLVKVHYKCWLLTDPNKQVIDSSRLTQDDNEPVEFNLGMGSVIKAIDVGVRSMTKKGEKALFIAHYDFAFGRNSSRQAETSNIPNCSFIGLEMELVDVDDGWKDFESEDITREIVHLSETEESDVGTPLNSSTIMFVNLKGFKVNKTTDDLEEGGCFLPEIVLPYTPCFNSWGFFDDGLTQYPIPHDFGRLLKSQRVGDTILYTLSGESAFQMDFEANGVAVKMGEPVEFFVQIDTMEEVLDPFELSFAEKVAVCEKLIDQGNFYFNKNWNEAAISKFNRVREYLSKAKLYLKKIPLQFGKKCDNLLYYALCKMAELYWKLPEMTAKEALQYCNEAMKILEAVDKDDSSSNSVDLWDEKEAYYLRARIYAELKEFKLAKIDFSKAIKLIDKKIASLRVKEGRQELDGETEIGSVTEQETSFEKFTEWFAKVKIELKEIEEKEAVDKRKRCVFKYVPPK